MNVDLEDVIDKIIKQTKTSKREILKRIEVKKEDLGGLITDEGAACIVAKELGVEIFEEVTFKRKRIQINDLTIGMNAISIVGRVNSIFPIHEFTRKNGQKGELARFILEDSTGQIRVILWNTQTKIVADGKIEENDIIELKNAYIKEGLDKQLELHLGRRGDIDLNPKDIDITEFENISPISTLIKISALQVPMWNVNLIGKIDWISRISSFSRQNGTGQVASLSIFDETGQTRVALWDDHASFVEHIGINDIVRILHGYTREGRDNSIELHVGKKSSIQKEGSISIDLPDRTATSPSPNEVKIKDLVSESKNLKIIGKVIEKGDPREVKAKDDSLHQVCDVELADETGCISLSIWDDEIDKIQKGKTYCVENGYVSIFRGTLQLNVGKFGIIKETDKVIKRVNRKKNLSEQTLEAVSKFIMDIEENEIVEIIGTIVSIPEKKPIYNSCPNCFKKVTPVNDSWNCKVCGDIPNSVPRMLFSFTLDDGTDNIRVTVIDKVAEHLLGMSTQEAKKMIEEELIEHYPLEHKRKDLEGKNIVVTGNSRYNSFTSKLELMATTISYPNPREEISKILARVETYI